MLEKGSFLAVNGTILPNHFLVYLGGNEFMDMEDRSVYYIEDRQVMEALNTPSRMPNRKILDFVEVLPERVYEVVEANAKREGMKRLCFFNPEKLK